MKEQEQNLSRGLKPRHLQLLALGGIIGSGYFLGTGYVLEQAGPAAILSYLFGGLIVLCVMLCLGELAVARPVASSFIGYAREHISPVWACGVGWAYWVTWIAYVPSEMIAGGIIMNSFVPEVSQVTWAVLLGLLVTAINLFQVDKFGETEFWLALIKISALVMFVAIAAAVMLGLTGEEFIGTSILLGSGGFTPNGYTIVLLTMVMILVNFQGSEIIGLAAGECKNPEKSIPMAVRNVTWRIIALYIIPITLLLSIYPWTEATLSESVFAAALNAHGFHWAGSIFAFVVLTAAISCSNSGLYGCVRALFALGCEGMAPKAMGKLDRNYVPRNAVLASIAGCWVIIGLYTLDASEMAYTYLLALSGFAGAMAWISICWSQYNFRKKLRLANLEHTLKYKTPFFPYVTLFGIWAQVICLVVMAFLDDLRVSLLIGLPTLIGPMLWYWNKQRKQRSTAK